MKTLLPMIITFVGGAVVLLDYFVEGSWTAATSNAFLSWSVLLAAFSTFLGGANILFIHARNVKDKRPNWGQSVLLALSLVVWFVVGVVGTTESDVYKFVWQNVYSTLSATMFALNAFFIASAAYRSFRLRGAESAILMFAALLVMLGRVGIGEAISSRLPMLADWLMAIPGTAGMRGITIGGALGAVTVGLRVILGLERGGTGMSA